LPGGAALVAVVAVAAFVRAERPCAAAPLLPQQNTSPAAAPAAASGPLSLSAATTAALSANPLSRSAREQLTQAQARLAQAQAQQRLQVLFSTTGGVSDARVYAPPPARETFGTLVNTLTIPLPFGRRPRLAVAQADALVAAAQAQVEASRLSLAGQVATAYYDVLRKQALLVVAQENQANAARQAGDAQKRFRAGDVPELDVLRTQTPVAAAEAAFYQADTALAAARQTLNGLLGRPLDDAFSVTEAESPPAAMTLAEARERAVKNSPDVRAAEASVRAQEIAQQAVGLWREPIYSLQGSDTRSNDQTGFARLDTIEATITIPLSDGGLARAQVREARSALEQARAQAESARRTTLVTVSTAYLLAQGSLRQVAAARVAREIAQTTYEKTVRGYQAGLFPLTDVLSAQSALAQARVADAQARYDAAAAAATLNNALGNLPQQP